MRSVVALLRTLGTDRPKIALLSATESVLAAVPSSVEGRALAEWATEHLPEADVAGPLALDLILSSDAAQTKGLGNDPVAGRADAIIVPDIVSGNALFKALVYVGGGCAAGIVMGAKVPILLTSRADPAAARMASVALACVVAAERAGDVAAERAGDVAAERAGDVVAAERAGDVVAAERAGDAAGKPRA